MSKTYTIIINTGNSAFDDNPNQEVARILRNMAQRLDDIGFLPHPRDINGNTVGATIETEGS